MGQKPRPDEYPDQRTTTTTGTLKPAPSTRTQSARPVPPSADEYPDQTSDSVFQREATWPETIASGALRTIPAIGGGMMGGTSIIGNIAGGAAGAAVGEGLAQTYEINKGIRKDYSLSEGTIQTLAGAIPLLSKWPGATAPLKQLLAYVAKSSAEGAIVNATSTFPMHVAQSGKMEFPSVGEVAGSAAIGAGFGGTVAAGRIGIGRHGTSTPPTGLGRIDVPPDPHPRPTPAGTFRPVQQNVPQVEGPGVQMNLPDMGVGMQQPQLPFPPRGVGNVQRPTGPEPYAPYDELQQPNLFGQSGEQLPLDFSNPNMWDEGNSIPETQYSNDIRNNLTQYGVVEAGRRNGRVYFAPSNDLGLENLRKQTPDVRDVLSPNEPYGPYGPEQGTLDLGEPTIQRGQLDLPQGPMQDIPAPTGRLPIRPGFRPPVGPPQPPIQQPHIPPVTVAQPTISQPPTIAPTPTPTQPAPPTAQRVMAGAVPEGATPLSAQQNPIRLRQNSPDFEDWKTTLLSTGWTVINTSPDGIVTFQPPSGSAGGTSAGPGSGLPQIGRSILPQDPAFAPADGPIGGVREQLDLGLERPPDPDTSLVNLSERNRLEAISNAPRDESLDLNLDQRNLGLRSTTGYSLKDWELMMRDLGNVKGSSLTHSWGRMMAVRPSGNPGLEVNTTPGYYGGPGDITLTYRDRNGKSIAYANGSINADGRPEIHTFGSDNRNQEQGKAVFEIMKKLREYGVPAFDRNSISAHTVNLIKKMGNFLDDAPAQNADKWNTNPYTRAEVPTNDEISGDWIPDDTGDAHLRPPYVRDPNSINSQVSRALDEGYSVLPPDVTLLSSETLVRTLSDGSQVIRSRYQTPSIETHRPEPTPEVFSAASQRNRWRESGYAVLPPDYTGPLDDFHLVSELDDGSRVIDPTGGPDGINEDLDIDDQLTRFMQPEPTGSDSGGNPSGLPSTNRWGVRGPSEAPPDSGGSGGRPSWSDETGSAPMIAEEAERVNKKLEGWGWGQGSAKHSQRTEAGEAYIDEVLGLAKAATTIGDYSYTLKHALPMLFSPHHRVALLKSIKGGWNENFAKQVNAELENLPLFQKSYNPTTMEFNKSVAEKVGLDLKSWTGRLSKRGELAASSWLENGQFFGIPESAASRAYANSWGRLVRGSNRSFTTMRNYIMAHQTQGLFDAARNMAIEAHNTGSAKVGTFDTVFGSRTAFTPEEAVNLNPYENLDLGKDIVDFMKTALGEAPLKGHILPHKDLELDIEHMARGLTRVFFAPRLAASRIRMLNPSTYIMAPPFVRKQYLKAAMSSAVFWFGMAKAAEMTGAAEVSWDPDSADFAVLRFGDRRLDFSGGFKPFLVAMHRFWLSGGYKPSSGGPWQRYGEGYQAQTQLDQLYRVVANKLEPLSKFAHDLLDASEYQQFHVGDRTAQLFMSLTMQDAYEILTGDNPEHIALMLPIIFGAGTQMYTQGETPSRLIPEEYDWNITGGGMLDRVKEVGEGISGFFD